MAVCKNENCNAEMPDDAYFCEKCGEVMHDQNNNTDSMEGLGNGITSAEENGSMSCFSCGERLEIGTKFCPACGKQQPLAGQSSEETMTTASKNSGQTPPIGQNTSSNKIKEPIFAAILCIIPGLGQAYNGQIQKAIVYFIGGVLLSFITVGIGYFIYLAIGAMDAYVTAEKINRGEPADNFINFIGGV